MLILYGVFPEVVIDWTQDGLAVQHVLQNIKAGGGCEACTAPDVYVRRSAAAG